MSAVCVIADVMVLALALYLASGLLFTPPKWLSPAEVLQLVSQFQHLVMLTALVYIWLKIYRYAGLYRQRTVSTVQSRDYRLIELIMATSFGTFIIMGTGVLAGLDQIAIQVALAFWATVTLGTLLVREMEFWILRQVRLHGRNLRHLLIVGTNERAQKFARNVATNKELGYLLRGLVDDEWVSGEVAGGEDANLIVCGLSEVGEYLKDNVVDEVVIALPVATYYQDASEVVQLCEEQGIVVHFAPGFDFLSVGSSNITLNRLDNEPIITINPPPMSGWQLEGKRLMDVAGSLAMITILLPVFIAVSALIKLDSKGPVLFIQKRVGHNKRIFPLIKFRTMVTDAEARQEGLEQSNEVSGPVFKIEKDPRITRIGEFLRKSSLDELPQLFNVLMGDMSLVGPRPLPLRDYAGFEKHWHRRRLSVRPGITCIWQVSGRSSISFEQWMELDMEYIDKWSLWLDCKILLATIPAVLFRRGAV